MRAKMRRCFSRLKSSGDRGAGHLEVEGVVQQDGAEHEPLGVYACGKSFFESEIRDCHFLGVSNLNCFVTVRKIFFGR